MCSDAMTKKSLMKSNEVENRRDNLFEITISQDVFINTIEFYVPLLS